jgi:hypothetical protein
MRLHKSEQIGLPPGFDLFGPTSLKRQSARGGILNRIPLHLQTFDHLPPNTSHRINTTTEFESRIHLYLVHFAVPQMASSYSIIDQAADLGIHRVHSLVLGDAKKEARIAARFGAPQLKRTAAILGKGDVRNEERQHVWETRRELERIARRNNLKTYLSLSSQMELKPLEFYNQLLFVVIGA